MCNRRFFDKDLTIARVLTIFIIQWNEGFQINVILPFVVFMCRDFGFSENQIGTYAGLLTATFALTQFLSSYFWGWASDIYGRKKILLVGCIVSGIAVIIFGASTSYAQAIIGRSIAGVFNGNVGVLKAYTADITNQQNRAFAFSIIALAFSVGIITGSTLGGILIKSYDADENDNFRKSESILQIEPFYTVFPYLLPCLFGSIISILGGISVMLYIEDTKIDNFRELKQSISEANTGEVNIKVGSTLKSDDISRASEGLQQSLLGIETDANVTNSLHDLVKILKSNGNAEAKPLKNDSNSMEFDTLSKLVYNTPLKHTLLVVSSLMFFLVAWNAQSSIFLAQALDFDSLEIGIFMAYTGIVLLTYTWFVQPRFLNRFSHRPMYILNSILMIFVIFGFPSLIWLPTDTMNKGLLLVITAFIGGFKFVFSVSMYVIAQVFVNNSVPSDSIGRANGIAQAIQSLFRGLGPVLTGTVWSWSISQNDNDIALYAAYILLFIFEFFPAIWMIIFLKNDIMYPYEIRMAMIKQPFNDTDTQSEMVMVKPTKK